MVEGRKRTLKLKQERFIADGSKEKGSFLNNFSAFTTPFSSLFHPLSLSFNIFLTPYSTPFNIHPSSLSPLSSLPLPQTPPHRGPQQVVGSTDHKHLGGRRSAQAGAREGGGSSGARGCRPLPCCQGASGRLSNLSIYLFIYPSIYLCLSINKLTFSIGETS